MGMTTTLPASITLAAIGDTESGTGVLTANSGTTTFNFDDTVISLSLTLGSSVNVIPDGYELATFSYNVNVDDITVTAVGNGTTTLEIVSGAPSVTPTLSIPITVGAVDDDEFLNKRGLTHFWENVDDIKQDKLTAGAGISILNNVISATGGGEADSVAWGHITGTLSNQTDLNTALGAKANTADLATVATSGSYSDLSNKPTIPGIKRRTGASTTVDFTPLYIAGNGTTTNPMAFQTHGDSHSGSFSYVNINEPTNSISEAYIGGYVWDEYESWWRKMTETRLALYSDIPTIPTIGNATLTIQKNGTSAGTFTANATSNKTINITVPTTAADVSALPASTKYAASLTASINTTTYVMTMTLKDQDGNTLGTAQTIDLPLESVVVNGSYDSTNKKIVLTLQNGNTIDIPVADLIAGLQSEITSTNKLASDLVDDTNQTNKFMTSAEKTKLSGIAAGAEVNVQSDWNQTTTTADDYIKNKPALAAVATSGSYNDLSNKPTIPAAQIQSDWAQTSTTALDYIKNKPTLATVATSGSYNDLSNKPTIPTVNNGTLTIQKNGSNVATFTANQGTNATANIVVPTATSQLTNDSDFLTSSTGVTSVNGAVGAVNLNIPTKTSDLTNDSGYVSTSDTGTVSTTMLANDAVTSDKIVGGSSSATLANGALVEVIGTTTGSNLNYALKYSDGRLICFQRYSWSGVNINSPWGGCYTAQVMTPANYAVSFIALPVVSATPAPGSSNFNFWIATNMERGLASLSHPPAYQIVRPSVGNGSASSIDIVAYGFWK